MQSFADMLIARRTALGMKTTAALARRLAGLGCEVTEAAVGHWERGVRRPRREHMQVLAEALDWTPTERVAAENALAALPAQDAA